MTQNTLRVQALFAAAVELAPPQRAEMLARECAGDPQLLAELEALLEADVRLQGTTAQPIAAGLTQIIPALTPQASLTGMRVGPYELREQIGGGGMGTVYRAERVDGSVTQQVAIKFVRRELLDAMTLKRFQLERQLMATLNHPHIARLLDAAQLDDGTPYYVMEFVAGLPIDEYCDSKQLDVRQRVALMRKVCSAVSEAHRELVVHRDLKPSNILVDSSGNPKLLDFGIAKPLSASPAGSGDEDTGTAYRYFSPQYAAPEQLAGAPVGVACDVYGLGLLLYELLTGSRPFDLAGLSAGQAERLIKQVPPAAPSNALARHGGAGIRARQLRGDLDDIVLRCLRKLPSERYASVEQLETDLGNYCDGRPVLARGGHGWYRARKYVLRNKLAVSGGLLLMASLIAGVVAFAWQARIANRRAAELELVSQFQADMLAQVDPTQAGQLLSKNIEAKFEQALVKDAVPTSERGAQLAAFDKQWTRINATDAARDLIDGAIVKPAVDAIDTKFKNQPLVYASLSQVLAKRYREWGLLEAAHPLQVRALETRRRELGEDHPDTLSSLDATGLQLHFEGKLADAENYLRDALERRRRVLGPEHRDTLTTMTELGALLPARDKMPEAELLLRGALESLRREFGAEDNDTLIALNELGYVLRQEGKLDEAEGLYRRSLEARRRVFGPDHPLTLVAVASMAELLRIEGKFAEAEPYFREDLEKRLRVQGESHPETIKAINAMGTLLGDEGKAAESEGYLRDALEKSRRVLGPDHPDTVQYIDNVAIFFVTQGKNDEAEPYLIEALDKRRHLFGAESSEVLRTTIQLGTLREAQRRHADAIEILAPIESVSRKTFTGGNVFHFAKLSLALGLARARLGDLAAAKVNLDNAVASFELDPGVSNGDRADCAAAFAILYAAWDKTEPGKGYAAKATESARKAHELDPELPPIAPVETKTAQSK